MSEHTQEMLLPPATPFFRSPKLEVDYERENFPKDSVPRIKKEQLTSERQTKAFAA
uniref:HDC15611 n=1 Tax=Drosophila melanogaster TaxID=7227 RepID=Q6IJ93_DROME|nr:TPA_inf: HDC15611 [Drosophila melanogaster]